MPRQPTPKEIIERDKRVAIRQSTIVGRARLGVLLRKADDLLTKRFYDAGGLKAGTATFTAAQAGVAMTQVREVIKELHAGMKGDIVKTGKTTATKATADTIKYLDAAEKKFRGVTAELPLKTAMIADRVNANTESSILHRIETDPKHPGRPGVLERYDKNVVRQFEEELQLRMVARQPWSEVRTAITEASPFLKGQPAFWAERIVRTETMHAHNRASWETMREVDEQMGDMLKILSATFDDRTGADSYAVHGQIRRVNESFESWFGEYMHPPNRPNDREVVVPHRMSWPLPGDLEPMTDSDVDMRWEMEGRKGSPPMRPVMSTVHRTMIGKVPPPAMKAPVAAPPPPPTKPPVPKPPPKPVKGKPPKISKSQQGIVDDLGAGGHIKKYQQSWMTNPVWKLFRKDGTLKKLHPATIKNLRVHGLIDAGKQIDKSSQMWGLTPKGTKAAAVPKAAPPPKAAPTKPEVAAPVTAPITKAKVGPGPYGPTNKERTVLWATRSHAAMSILEQKGVALNVKLKAQRETRAAFRGLLKRDGFTESQKLMDGSMRGKINVKKMKGSAVAHIFADSKLVEIDTFEFKQATTAMRTMAKGKMPTKYERESIATLVHEEVHAYSRFTARGGQATAIEEAATEAIARRQINRLYGEKGISKTSGAYQTEINGVTSSIMKHAKVTKEQAFDMFAEAATRTRQADNPKMNHMGSGQVRTITDNLPVTATAREAIVGDLAYGKKWWDKKRNW